MKKRIFRTAFCKLKSFSAPNTKKPGWNSSGAHSKGGLFRITLFMLLCGIVMHALVGILVLASLQVHSLLGTKYIFNESFVNNNEVSEYSFLAKENHKYFKKHLILALKVNITYMAQF